MNIKLLTEHHFEYLSLIAGCTSSSESTLVKMPHCWKSRVAAQFCLLQVVNRDNRTEDYFVLSKVLSVQLDRLPKNKLMLLKKIGRLISNK